MARTCLSYGYAVLGAHFPASSLPKVSDKYAISLIILPIDFASNKCSAGSFYLATDETNSTALAYYRASGAVLLSDLVNSADVNATLGSSASYSDVLSLVEQVILSRSDYFVGSGMSSTTGGVINMRLARGKEEWSWDFMKKW